MTHFCFEVLENYINLNGDKTFNIGSDYNKILELNLDNKYGRTPTNFVDKKLSNDRIV